jgi:fatty-acyl-CoA synthase
LPACARPLFVRICAQIDMTETFKPRKQALASEGFDPRATYDPIYVDDRSADAYVLIDEGAFAKIQWGEVRF